MDPISGRYLYRLVLNVLVGTIVVKRMEFERLNMNSERGRPRGFCKDEALDKALAVFWKHGFQGASLAELTAAMGVNKPSLYAAFGDKESLYLKALDRYLDQQMSHQLEVLDTEPDARRAVEDYLRAVATMQTNPVLPGGCFVITGTADCGGASMPVAIEKALFAAIQSGEERIAQRLDRAQREGQLPQDLKTGDLATLFISMIAGMGVLAKSGASLDKLHTVVTTAMLVWPSVATTKTLAP